MIGYHTNAAPSLGAYAKSTDFHCATTGGGNYVCWARVPNSAVTSSYKQLQQTIRTIAAKMAKSGRLNVPADLTLIAVDGAIGKITSIGVQFIAAAFSRFKPMPPAVAEALSSNKSAQQIVEGIAKNAREINAYFTDVLTNFPAAVSAPLPPQKSPWGVVAATFGVLALLGVATYFATRPKPDAVAWL